MDNIEPLHNFLDVLFEIIHKGRMIDNRLREFKSEFLAVLAVEDRIVVWFENSNDFRLNATHFLNRLDSLRFNDLLAYCFFGFFTVFSTHPIHFYFQELLSFLKLFLS